MTTQNLNIGTLPMVFANAAYSSDPQSVLNQFPEYTTGWNVVWANDFDQDNYAFVARSGNDFIVALRGSLLKWDLSKQSYQNWVDEDFNVLSQAAWNWFVPAGLSNTYHACITAGASIGLGYLQSITDVSSGVVLADYLVANAVNNNGQITITGHSLGGNLASVFAPWLQWYINNNANSNYNGKDAVYPNMMVRTFAAPGPGNLDFAGYYDAMFGNNCSRFYNTNDAVPTFPADLTTTANMFIGGPDANAITILDPDGKQVTLHDFWDSIRDIVGGLVAKNGYVVYVQTNTFEGNMPFTLPIDQHYLQNNVIDWFVQAFSQHHTQNYLNFFLALPQGEAAAQGSN